MALLKWFIFTIRLYLFESFQISIIANIENYKEYIRKCHHCFILYHHPWCKVSQRMEKELRKATFILPNIIGKTNFLNYSLGIFDITMLNPETIQLHFTAFPLFFYFEQGKVQKEYKGQYKKQEIALFIQQSLISRITHCNHYNELRQIIKIIDNVLLIVTPNELDLKISTPQVQSLIIQSSSSNIYNTTKINSKEIVLITFFKGKQIEKTILNDSTKIQNKISEFTKRIKQKEVYTSINENVINELIMKKKAGVILFRNKYDNQTESIEQYIKLNLSLEYSGLLFIITDITGILELKLSKLLKINNFNLPRLCYITHQDNQLIKYHYQGQKYTFESLNTFISNCLNKSNMPYFNSDEIQFKNNSTIKLISRTNFNYYLYHYSKGNQPLVLLICTDWCVYCKKV